MTEDIDANGRNMWKGWKRAHRTILQEIESLAKVYEIKKVRLPGTRRFVSVCELRNREEIDRLIAILDAGKEEPMKAEALRLASIEFRKASEI